MNPFSLTFGKVPANAISREKQLNEIVESFTSEYPELQACMITGIQGSGKTVMMTEVSSEIRKNKNWIVVELNPERDLLHSLAAELSNRKELLQIFKDAKINLSFLGFGLEIDAEPPITDIVVALDKMLEQMTRKGRKILITIDETVANRHLLEFVGQFQIFLRKQYNVFLLMTGIFEQINELQKEYTLTFLYRLPKIVLQPLNSVLVARAYKKAFDITEDESMQMANIVKGYPYAYQVLGYLCYKRNCSYSKVLDELDAYLGEYVYDKIWEELSGKDRDVMSAIAESENGKTDEVRSIAGMSSGEYSVYRDRLLKKGLVNNERYGYLEFSLPRFTEYAKRRKMQASL